MTKPRPISDEDYGTRPPMTKPTPLGGPQDGARPPTASRPYLGGYNGGVPSDPFEQGGYGRNIYRR